VATVVCQVIVAQVDSVELQEYLVIVELQATAVHQV